MMGKKLVIVESPTKANTIQKYLGNEYEVISSVGHIRDLAISGPGGLGVDVENQFKPKYVYIPGKRKIVNEIKKHVEQADVIYLATDPDREGEAISWHLYDALGMDKMKDKQIFRVEFHEITKNAILKAIENPRQIDENLVRSQESRRILDRIIGFKLSKLLQSKIKSKSAGRVQSVALKLIVDREREIQAFKPEEYYTIEGVFSKDDIEFTGKLASYKGKKVDLKTKQEADEVLSALTEDYRVQSIERKKRQKTARPPYITSTLQQDASSKLKFTSKKTMLLAQKLYEGVEVDGEPHGLITYIRTDSTRLSDEFIQDALAFIHEHYGHEYAGTIRRETGNSKNVQDAHEAIRPTHINWTPEMLKPYLSNDLYKLYRLIYYRALASLMANAQLEQTTAIIENNGYEFKANGQVVLFDGYLKVYNEFEETKEEQLPPLVQDDVVQSLKMEAIQHFTQPPARYTEARLIKEMEELGIGRPSTYAQTMETLKLRGYVKMENRQFVPTEQGFLTSDRLQEYFSDIINVHYTAQMEEDLDAIARGEKVWHEELQSFYDKFIPLVEHANTHMEKVAPKRLDETCPLCGKPLVVRYGRYGEFIGCSGYPECTYIKKEEKMVETLDIKCPKCGEGYFVKRVAKKGPLKGRTFYACNNYPKCRNIVTHRPVNQVCPECGNILTEKDGDIICENKSCSYSKKTAPDQ